MPIGVDSRELKKAWLAGFFDGEGCITLGTPNGSSGLSSLRVMVSQKCPALLEEIQKLHGGTLHKGVAAYTLQWDKAQEGRRVLESILPYLVLRHKEALIAIEICKLTKPRGQNLTDREKLLRYRLEDMLREAARERREILSQKE